MTHPQSVAWASVLDSLYRTNQPAYVEIDQASNTITQLLLPMQVRVGKLTPSASGDIVEVELIVSSARHTLRRTNANFDQLLARLQTAHDQGTTVLVTEIQDTHEIIDVRPTSD
jgi:hypothetical protein